MNSAAQQLRRLLAFLPQITDGREHRIADVAERLHVDAATVLRDLHELSERYGDPAGWVEKVQLFLEADRVSMEATRHFLRPTRLSADEWRAIELGLAMLRAERAPDDRAAIDAALAKVRQLTSQEPGDAATRSASVNAEPQAERIAALRTAIREHRRVAITYQKGSGDVPDRRLVCPFTFAVEQGIWYLVAHCQRSEAIRIFRLDRVLDLEITAETFEPPQELDLDALLARGHAFVGEPPGTLRVRYSPRVAPWIAEREQGTPNADGSLDVEYPLGDRAWAMRHVLQYGPEAEIIAPEDVRSDLKQRLARVLG